MTESKFWRGGRSNLGNAGEEDSRALTFFLRAGKTDALGVRTDHVTSSVYACCFTHFKEEGSIKESRCMPY